MYPDHLAIYRCERARAPSSEYTTVEATAIVLTLFCMAYLSFGLESYCYLCPTIDTRYAPGCSELKFRLVRVGMTKGEVLHRIGPPLGIGQPWTFSWRWGEYRPMHPAYKEWGDEVWNYTTDGAHPWADYAWLSRQLIFHDGRVVQKVFWTYYD